MVTTETRGGRAEREARRMFGAVLAGWAQDLLRLRRRGRGLPRRGRARRLLGRPAGVVRRAA